MLGSKKKEEVLPVNEALLNVITPMGLEIKRNSLVIGENLGKVYGAVRYPQKVDMGWLSKITNIPSSITTASMSWGWVLCWIISVCLTRATDLEVYHC